MKLLKFITFLSILGSIFIVIYRQSDEKGLRTWWKSFKIAVLVAAIAAGLIPNRVEASEPYVSNNQFSIERVLKISGGDESKFGPGGRAKADARKNSLRKGNRNKPGSSAMKSSRSRQEHR